MQGISFKDIKHFLEYMAEYRTEILAAAVVITFTMFFYNFVYSSSRDEIKKIDVQIKALESDKSRALAELEQKRKMSEKLKSSMEGLKQVERDFKDARSRLPSEKQLSLILEGIMDEDAKKGVRFISVKPMHAEEGKEFIRLPFILSMNGRFIPFGKYLENIERSSRLFTIEDFKIETKEDIQPDINIQLYLSTYVLQAGE